MNFKYFLLLFLPFTASNHLFSQDDSNEKKQVKFNKLKSKSAYEFKFHFGEKKPDSFLLYAKKYDQKGHLTENSSPAEKIIYQYNDKGKLIEEVSFNADNSIRYKDIYVYDNNGNLIEKDEYEGDGKLSFRISSGFNEKKQETEHIIFNPNGSIQLRQAFSFDDHGNKTEEAEYDSLSKNLSKKVSVYDSKKRISSMILSKHDSISSKYYYEYNDAGLKSKMICYNADGSINFKSIYEYDAKKNLIRETTYQGVGVTRIIWQYDIKGNPVTEVKYDEAGNTLSKSIYHYNNKNIITEETEYNFFDEPVSVIKYYYEVYPAQ